MLFPKNPPGGVITPEMTFKEIDELLAAIDSHPSTITLVKRLMDRMQQIGRTMGSTSITYNVKQ